MKKSLLKGALIIAIGGFVAKLLGAIYRVPLTNLLKSEGLGLYQMVFPVYCILLDFAGGGVPCGLSKLISGEVDEKRKVALIKNAVTVLAITGLIGSLFMFALSGVIAKAQGNPLAKLGYVFLSPSVCLVSILSCYRGYFQGENQMSPTAISQIIEQVIKLIFGLILVALLMPNVPLSVGGATFAVTLSELVALVYLFLKYKKVTVKTGRVKLEKNYFKQDIIRLLKICLPITLTGILIPISQTIDSFLIINILAKYMQNATNVYGLFSGAVMSVVNLPVSICYGLAVVAIPSLSSSKTQAETNKKGIKIILLTIAFSLPALIFLLIFAPFSINLLYSRLNQSEKIIAIALLRLTSPCVVLLSLVQATNAILIGRGRLYAPVLTLFVGVIIKTILNLLLLSNVNMNIYGGAIAIIACYFFVCLVNLILLRAKGTKNENKSTFNC